MRIKALSLFVLLSITLILLYTAICLFYGIQNDTLTTCFFSVFGGEIFTCAVLKVFKMKGGGDGGSNGG